MEVSRQTRKSLESDCRQLESNTLSCRQPVSKFITSDNRGNVRGYVEGECPRSIYRLAMMLSVMYANRVSSGWHRTAVIIVARSLVRLTLYPSHNRAVPLELSYRRSWPNPRRLDPALQNVVHQSNLSKLCLMNVG